MVSGYFLFLAHIRLEYGLRIALYVYSALLPIISLNLFLDPAIFVTGIVVQLVSLPFGHGLARILPRKQFNTFGYRWSFNPGPFSIKEHVCITVMANVCVAGAYSTEVILTTRVFYRQATPLSYQILLAVGSQVLGFSIGGILRQFVVWPASMIWPGALVNSALFNTLHRNYGKRERGHMSRERFFVYVVIGAFVWHWFPEYIFTGLSLFNWVCWIAPNNAVVNTLFGTYTGLGMSIITLDWGMIAFIGSPLVTPVRWHFLSLPAVPQHLSLLVVVTDEHGSSLRCNILVHRSHPLFHQCLGHGLFPHFFDSRLRQHWEILSGHQNHHQWRFRP